MEVIQQSAYSTSREKRENKKSMCKREKMSEGMGYERRRVKEEEKERELCIIIVGLGYMV